MLQPISVHEFLSHMNAWSDVANANVQFVETASDPQVRIARTAGDGYWSYLGTDILSIEAGEPTMNLDSFTMNTLESEFHRVVRHETGHTLGFPHEHMRREIIDQIDQDKAIEYFMANSGLDPRPGHRPGSHASRPVSPGGNRKCRSELGHVLLLAGIDHAK